RSTIKYLSHWVSQNDVFLLIDLIYESSVLNTQHKQPFSIIPGS
ncbi:hypothetical protein LINPERPRIM_LOCUS13729, partial [Linum perenne]